jgi:hypothetical protein
VAITNGELRCIHSALAMLLLACGGDEGGGGAVRDGGADQASSANDASSGPGEAGSAGGATESGGGAGGSSGAGGGAVAGGADGRAGAMAGGETGTALPSSPVITPTPADTELATESGCAGVYNPDQILRLSLEFAAGDLNKILSDTTYAVVVPARMQCGDEPPLTVGVRRKRSGGREKVGLKIDINEFVPKQVWYGLKKLSLENGVSEGSDQDGANVREYISEYLAWRLMVRSGAISSRAAFVELYTDGEFRGVYLSVEQVDKRFLEQRLGDDSGWLYKKSGGVNDGLKTNETNPDNPYDDYFCFWQRGAGACAVPSDSQLAAELPMHLDIAQFLRFGAVNAYIANSDGPLFKENNYYYYDYASGPRVYIPWDLDSAMKGTQGLYSGGAGGTNSSWFSAVLFTNWRDDYTAILRELYGSRLTAEVIESELDRALLVAGDAFEADPYVTGTASGAVADLKDYWIQRLNIIAAALP